MKRINGFTLIELLAIIVILAIIAVITVPIILNIIENSKQGAATDSAYGYKDAVNKWYVSKLQEDNKYTLNGGYTITEGKLNDIEIPLSGDKPTSGNLHYTNSILDGGCLTIGEYKVTFDEKGNASNTEKGECIPTIPTCPGCKFIYTTDGYAVVGSSEAEYQSTDTDMPVSATDDYTELTSSHPYFLGIIESKTTPGKIGRAFACGIEGTTPFCVEGYDISKYSDDANVGILNTIYPGCNASTSDYETGCYGTSVNVDVDYAGNVGVYNNDGSCRVSTTGRAYCADSSFIETS